MKLRKYALLILILITPMIASRLTTNVVEASGIAVSVEPNEIYDTNMAPGTQFSVDITVDYIERLWGYQFWLSFNPAVLKGVSVENGPFLESYGGDVFVAHGAGFDNEVGELKIFGAFIYFEGVLPEHKLPIGGGVLATVTFEVVGYGGSPIKLGPETRLSNKTGGAQFGEEWCYGWWQLPPEPPDYGRWIPWEPWLNSLGHGRLENIPPLYVNPPEVKGVPPGKNFTIDISVTNMTGFHQWEFYLAWNATLLNATSVAEGAFLKDQPEGTLFMYEIKNDEGYARVNCTTTGEHPGVGGDGTIANVTFIVLDRGGSNLTLYNTSLIDDHDNPVDLRTADGYFFNLRFHNIAVTSVNFHPTMIEAGSEEQILINATVANAGDYNETGIDVTAYYDEYEIHTESDISLNAGAEVTLSFTWNTSGIALGKHIIVVTASTVAGEGLTTDNTKRGGEVIISGHNIAITEIWIPTSNVYVGHNVTIRVYVVNEGTGLETFDVTAYYDGEEIDTKTVASLGYLESRTLEFKWDTTGVELGQYVISANATVVAGEKEENRADNTLVREATVGIIPLQVRAWAAEVFVLPIIAVVIIVALWLFYRRRKAEEIPLYEQTR